MDGSASEAVDIRLTAPLHPSLVVEAGMSSGVDTRAAVKSSQSENDAKCKELGW